MAMWIYLALKGHGGPSAAVVQKGQAGCDRRPDAPTGADGAFVSFPFCLSHLAVDVEKDKANQLIRGLNSW
jgi:hypothetical protein